VSHPFSLFDPLWGNGIRWGRSSPRFPNRLRANTALGVWQKKPARIEVRSRQTEASRLRKPLARLTTEGVTDVLSEKKSLKKGGLMEEVDRSTVILRDVPN